MTFPTVIETPLRLEPVTRDPFGDLGPAAVAAPPSGTTHTVVHAGIPLAA